MEWFENESFWEDFYDVLFPRERFGIADAQVRQVLDLAKLTEGTVCDLCCGPGRHAIRFAQRGFRVTGVDRSAYLLQRARTRASEAGAEVEWVQEDMRRFSRPDAFNLVCNLFTSFGYFETEEDDRKVLRRIYENLKPGGVFVLDVLGKERLARVQEGTQCTDLEDGSLIIQRPRILADWCRVSNEWTLVKEGRAITFRYEHNIYSGRELRDMLRSCGFAEIRLFGDLGASPYGLEATRLVATARKSSVPSF